MSSLDLLKTVAIALVLLVIGVACLVFLRPFDPIIKLAAVIALGVVASSASLIFFYAALKA
jgi:uncharacterized membrane protein YgaE (UPF0421/DUF939 family)